MMLGMLGQVTTHHLAMAMVATFHHQTHPMAIHHQEDILLVTRHRIIHQVMVAAMAMVKREVLHHHHRVVLLAMEVMTCMQVIHLQAMVAVMAASRARARAAATPAMAAIPATAVMGAEGNGAEILTDATSGAMEEGEMIEMMIGLGEIMMEVKEVVGEKEERDLKAMVVECLCQSQ